MENSQSAQDLNQTVSSSEEYVQSATQSNDKIFIPIPILILIAIVSVVAVSASAVFLGLTYKENKQLTEFSTQHGDSLENTIKTEKIPLVKNYSVLFSVRAPDYTTSIYQSDVEGKNLRVINEEISVPVLLSTHRNARIDNNTQRFVTEDDKNLVTFPFSNYSQVTSLYTIPDGKVGALSYPVLSTNGKNVAFTEDLNDMPATRYSPAQQGESNVYSVAVDGSGLKKIYSFIEPNGFIVLYRYFSETNEILMQRDILPDFEKDILEELSVIPEKLEEYLTQKQERDFPLEIIDASTGTLKKTLANLGTPLFDSKYRFTDNLDMIYHLAGDERNLQFIEYSINSDKNRVLYTVPLTNGNKDFKDIQISQNGEELLLTYQDTRTNKVSVQIINLQTKKVTTIYDSAEYVLRPESWSPDGNYIFASRADKHDKSTHYILDRNGNVVEFKPQTNVRFKQTSEGRVSLDEITFLGWVKN